MAGITTSRVPHATPKGLLRVPLGWCAAAVGSTTRGTAGRRSATATRPTTAASSWASASPGLLPLALDRLYPWPAFWAWRERGCEEGSEAQPRQQSGRATRRPATSTSLAALPDLNPTSVLPGAISLAESVSVKDYWQFAFMFRSNSPIHGPTPASETVGVKSMARELFHFSYLRAPDSLLPLVTRTLG